jgi:hypothetical protein
MNEASATETDAKPFDFFNGFLLLDLDIKVSQALLAVLLLLREDCPFPINSSPLL